jgi:DNA-binding transcriptional MocR family regulator
MVERPDGWSTSALLERSVPPGICFMPCAVFFAYISDHLSQRLSISSQTLASLAEGLRRLATAGAPVGAT